MERFSVVSDELLPVQSLTQFLIDIGVRGTIAVHADDGGYQSMPVRQLDSVVLSRAIRFCTSRVTELPAVRSVVPVYIDGERFTIKKATWNPTVGEVELALGPAKPAALDSVWTIPMCRYKIGNLRPHMSAWWVPRPTSDL